MNVLEGLILGAVQGLTEFLPVSSSGHLVLAQSFLGVEESGVTLEVIVHAATLVAVLIYFRKRIVALAASLGAIRSHRDSSPETRRDLRTVGYLAAASVPAGVVGLLFEDAIGQAFEDPRAVCALLCFTGIVLLLTRLAPKPDRAMSLPRALVVGIAQALALLPGVSRSGSTISAALFLKIGGAEAAEFSMLLSLPAVGGAVLLKALRAPAIENPLALAAAFAVALASGVAAIVLLMGVLARRSFWVFGVYCLLIGAGGFLALSLWGR